MHIIQHCFEENYVSFSLNDKRFKRSSKFSSRKQQSHSGKKIKEKRAQKMDFKVLNASDSLVSMQFSEYMKLPQVCQPQL